MDKKYLASTNYDQFNVQDSPKLYTPARTIHFTTPIKVPEINGGGDRRLRLPKELLEKVDLHRTYKQNVPDAAETYNSRPRPGIKLFLCEHCGKKIPRLASRNRHIEIHTRIKNDDSEPKPKPPKIYPCLLEGCGKSFAYPWGLKSHQNTHPGKPLRCEKCDRTFIRTAIFKRHMRSHIRKLKYKCEQCILGFNSALDLDEHLKLHENGAYSEEDDDSNFESASSSSTAFNDVSEKQELLIVIDTDEDDNSGEDEKCIIEIENTKLTEAPELKFCEKEENVSLEKSKSLQILESNVEKTHHAEYEKVVVKKEIVETVDSTYIISEIKMEPLEYSERIVG